jgi:hypothetical protein
VEYNITTKPLKTIEMKEIKMHMDALGLKFANSPEMLIAEGVVKIKE